MNKHESCNEINNSFSFTIVWGGYIECPYEFWIFLNLFFPKFFKKITLKTDT